MQHSKIDCRMTEMGHFHQIETLPALAAVCFAPKSDIQRASNYALADDADQAAAGHPGGAVKAANCGDLVVTLLTADLLIRLG